MQSDYLKYWRVVRYFVKAKYKLNQEDLEMLLFLYSEKYFDKGKFQEYNNLLGWNKNRFEKLRQEGWIEVFRKGHRGRRSVYCLSYKTKRVIKSVYNKLEGEEIPVSPDINPMFLKNVSYSDKVYRNMIIEMNKFIKQQRHLPEK
tara:strand:- start:431 stop:865 length:435 start_codon:yes stop_codon:yes gene_type:complete